MDSCSDPLINELSGNNNVDSNIRLPRHRKLHSAIKLYSLFHRLSLDIINLSTLVGYIMCPPLHLLLFLDEWCDEDYIEEDLF